MAQYRGIRINGIPVPPINIPDSIPEDQREAFAQQFLTQQLEQKPDLIDVWRDRAVNRMGLTEQDLDNMARQAAGEPTQLQAETDDLNIAQRTGMGILRGADRLQRGLRQLGNEFMVVSEFEIQNMLENGQIEERHAEQLRERNVKHEARINELKTDEAAAREVYRSIDESEGLLGSTIGFEDVGELIPEALAFLGSGGTGTLAMAGRAALVGAAGATTEDESRIMNTIVSGAFGAVLPGALKVAQGAVRNAKFFGRMTLGMLGSAAGIRGMGRASTILAKIGGEARRLQLNEGDVIRLRELSIQGADRLRPIIQGMSSRQVKDVQRRSFRDLMASNFRKNLDPTLGREGQMGLDVPSFIREIEHLASPTLRSRLGTKWGNEMAEFVEFGRAIAPEMDQILQRGLLPDTGVRGVLNSITDYLGSGSFRAIRGLRTPTAREAAYRAWFNKLTGPISRGAAMEATDDDTP